MNPLYDAANAGDLESIKHLLDTGPAPGDLNVALTAAAAEGHADVVQALIAAGPSEEALRDGLCMAAQQGHVATVEAFIQGGADVNGPDSIFARTPLRAATEHGHIAVMQVLLDHGADINARSGDGTSPVIVATRSDRSTIVKFLIEHGADLNVIDEDGMGPMDYAIEFSYSETVSVLEAAGASTMQWDAKEQVKELLQDLATPTYKPLVDDGEGEVLASRFGGRPWLAEGEEWPSCLTCTHPFTFFLQLQLDTLPNSLVGRFGSGLLQFFYCTQCQPAAAFATEQLVRIVHPTLADAPTVAPVPAGVIPFPAKHIVRWWAIADYPYREVGMIAKYRFAINLPVGDAVLVALNQSGDKVGGWPHWIQDMAYPLCPQSHCLMDRMIIQLDSEYDIPYMWGDNGTGYIFQSPEHPEIVTFLWQSE